MAAIVEVIWTDDALLRFQNILGYHLERNETNAYPLKLQMEVERVLDIVESFPNIGKLCDDGKTRIVHVEKYELLYQMIDERILVVDFWDPKKNPNQRRDLQD